PLSESVRPTRRQYGHGALGAGTQQASVSHITHERVFEYVRCLRRGGPAKKQFSVCEGGERCLYLDISFLRDNRQRFVWKLSSYGGTNLRYLPGNGTEAIKARH